MIHEDPDSFCGRHIQMVFIVATDFNRRVIRNMELHGRDRFDASAFELTEPLV